MKLSSLLAKIKNLPGFPNISGLYGASKSLVLSQIEPPFLVLTSTSERATQLKEELEFIQDKEVLLFPAPDTLPGENLPASREITGSRLAALERIQSGEDVLVVAPVRATLFKTEKRIQKRTLKQGEKLDLDKIIEDLVSLGYKRLSIVGERGEFSVRGGILDIFAYNLDEPLRAELLDDKIESLRIFNPQTQRSIEKIEQAAILQAKENPEAPLFDLLPNRMKVIVDEPLEVERRADEFIDEVKALGQKEKFISMEEIKKKVSVELSSFLHPGAEEIFSAPESFDGNLDKLKNYLESQKGKSDIYLLSKHAARLKEVIDKDVLEGKLWGGFISHKLKAVLLTDKEIFSEKSRPVKHKPLPKEGINRELLADLNEGDCVVHESYGISIYQGTQKLKEEGVEREYLLLEFKYGDRIYVPLTMMGMVEKYSSSKDFIPKLTSLRTKEWFRTKGRVRKRLKDMTAELLGIYAVRQSTPGFVFPRDDIWQKELVSTFPYEETPDQLKAIRETKADMESSLPMDRLVCGDVGYGKTEVAIRAAAKAVSAGKQAAILVPTTILAEQHYNNLKERFQSFPCKIEMLSRFRTKENQKQIIDQINTGEVDVVIGTHRLLQKDVHFKDLGLLVIDEEQRFGVRHKEKLKKFKRTVDVLTLTATPIPRTLYLSLSGARDMSIINTPPLDRSPIRTYVLQFSEAVIKEAIRREIDRGGQIYFVHNVVETIDTVAKKLKDLLPGARLAVAHGQMNEKKLEQTMIDFLGKKHDILLCTAIIESGLDIPNVNTILIDRADHFGLSQLYQLRGRVGRSATRAYAYLFYHPKATLTKTAIERLKAIQEFTSLGSGYKLSMRDLEIRGAGNLLGGEQSGHIASVGFDMYCELLEEAMREIKGIKEPTPKQVEVDIKVDAYIPEDYVTDEKQRIALYRRMNLLSENKGLEEMVKEMEDRFGKTPHSLKRLFAVIKLKLSAQKKGIKLIKEMDKDVLIEWLDKRFIGVKVKNLNSEEKIKKLSAFLK